MSLDLEQLYYDLGDAKGGAGQLAGCHILARSESLVNYQSATNKQYQAVLALGPAKQSGDIVWLGVCVYGPGNQPQRQQTRVYEGMDVHYACQAANNKLLSKLKRGYEAPMGGYPQLLSGTQVLYDLEEGLEELPQLETRPAASSALEQALDLNQG